MEDSKAFFEGPGDLPPGGRWQKNAEPSAFLKEVLTTVSDTAKNNAERRPEADSAKDLPGLTLVMDTKISNTAKRDGQVDAGKTASDSPPVSSVAEEEKAKEREFARASKYLEAHEKADCIGKAVLILAALPGDVSISSGSGKLRLASSDFVKVAEAIPGASLDPTFLSLLSSIKSAQLDGRKFSLEARANIPVKLGDGVPVAADLKLENPSFEIKADGKNPNCIHMENITGLSASVLGIGGEIKKISLSLVKDDAGKTSLQIDIPKPLAKAVNPDERFAQFAQQLKGKIGAAIPENSRITIPLDSPVSVQIVERAFKAIKDYSADPESVNPRDIAANIAGADLSNVLGGLLKDVEAVEKHGDKISFTRQKGSSHDFGGVIVEAGRKIQAKVSPDGDAGFRISAIEGVHLKLPVQLPELVKEAGIDPGNQIYTKMSTFNLSSADSQGRRKVLFETDHLLRQVGLMLDSSMKPALDPKGNWYMYGFVDNSLAGKKLPLALRFDGKNELAMSAQELMRIGSLAAWQAKDNGGLEGAGFGVIAVATEAGALALDLKDAVVDTAVVVKDKVVQGAVVVKDAVVDGAVVVGGAVKDGAVYLGNKISDGASTVGGWVKSGWRSIVGD